MIVTLPYRIGSSPKLKIIFISWTLTLISNLINSDLGLGLVTFGLL